MSDEDPYLYPGSSVIRNKLDITGSAQFAIVERALVTQRITEGVPAGNFDLAHLQAIHLHLFQGCWIEASRAAHSGDYGPMGAEISRTIVERKQG